MRKTLKIHIIEKINIFEMLKIGQVDQAGFKMGFTKVLTKISGATKRIAKEVMIIDRSNSRFTIKKHKVEEVNETGVFKTVHNHKKYINLNIGNFKRKNVVILYKVLFNIVNYFY